jgi:iron-sulfur cluster assembly protein
MFSVTSTALTKLSELRENDSDILQVSIVGGGCSGFSYQMKWIDYRTPYDRQIFFLFGCGITVVTDSKSALFLEDIQLDYKGGLNGKGFVWNNAKAKRVCGCGSSFST